MKRKLTIALTLAMILFNACAENYNSTEYLRKVLNNLEKIESASFQFYGENWNPGDTAFSFAFTIYEESYRNVKDTTIGASWAIFDNQENKKLDFAYDGKMKADIYHDEKGILIDSFNVRKLPFRPLTVPFYFQTESIIRYILENKDSTTVEQKEMEDEIYIKLTIHEDKQVEFFGKAHYIPKPPFFIDPTSIYELWISKKTNLPFKYRKEMFHNTIVGSVSNSEFNKMKIEDFVPSAYFPKDYEIRQHEQTEKKKQTNELTGKKAFNWTLESTTDKLLSLNDLSSKVMMIQFTSVSCGPCRASIPFLNQLTSTYKKEDFDFVAIECTSKSINALKNYQNKNGINYKFLLSTKNVLEDYKIKSFPVFFILDKNFIVKKVINGYGSGSTDAEINTIINEMTH